MFKNFFAICVGFPALAWSLHCSDPIALSDSLDEVGKDAPQIAVNERGDATVIWKASQGDQGSVLQISTKLNGGAWSEVETITPPSDKWKDQTEVVIDPFGKVSVLFKETPYYFASECAFYYLEKPLSGQWSPLFPIPISLKKYDASAVLSPKGEVMAVREEYWNPFVGKTIKAAKISAPFSAEPISFSTLSKDAISNPLIYMNDNGTIGITLWASSNDANTIYYENCSWYTNGEWSSAEKICSIPKNHQINSNHACVDDVGRGIICWDYSEKINGIEIHKAQVATYDDHQWSMISDLSAEDEEGKSPQGAINRQGDFFLVWDLIKGKEYEIGAAFKPKNQEWIRMILPSKYKDSNTSPEVKATPDGDFMVVWQRSY